MYIPGLSPRRKLERRRGGGGGGRGGGGARSSSGGSRGGGSRVSGTSKSASSKSNGSKSTSKISSGRFAGRQQGGGTRNQIYGTSVYGSGYPGLTGTRYGTSGLGFPFFFWPIAWGGVASYAGASYMYNNEYGTFDDTSRPGGVLKTATFPSLTTNATFRLAADEMSVASLIGSIRGNCSSLLASNASQSAETYDPNGPPKPEQVVQYFRASSLALTMDGYNNTGAAQDSNQAPASLPPYVDQPLLDCLNYTIGAAAPLMEEESGLSSGTITMIAIFSFIGFVALLIFVKFLWDRRRGRQFY